MKYSILSLEELKSFELKINQDIINYRKIFVLKIFLRYYFHIIRNCLNNNRGEEMSTIVISHLDSIKSYSYLNKYKYYVKYKNISLSYFTFFKELLKFPIYLYQYFTFKSKYKNQIFEAYLGSLIITNYVKRKKIDEVIFFGYGYDLIFLFATSSLNKNNIKTIQYCNSGFLGVHNLIVSNKLYCRTRIHKDYMIKRKDIFLSQNIEYLFDYKRQKSQKQIKKIAIYTSGYYARVKLKFSNINLLIDGISAEKDMINIMTEYALKNIDIEIVLFIHLHNDIENILDAKKYYSYFLSLKNVRLQKENENSLENFHNFDLGICCMSEIFFDRYEKGYKTILMNPFSLNDFIINSKIKNVTVYTKDSDIVDKINFYLQISNSKYFSLLNDA